MQGFDGASSLNVLHTQVLAHPFHSFPPKIIRLVSCVKLVQPLGYRQVNQIISYALDFHISIISRSVYDC